MAAQTLPLLKSTDLEPILGLPAVLKLTGAELSALVATTHATPQSGTDLANACMQMFYVFMALGQDAAALDMQGHALKLQKFYRIAAAPNPRIRLLALMAPGNMLDNTPLDFVVEGSSISLTSMLKRPGCFPPRCRSTMCFSWPSESPKNTAHCYGGWHPAWRSGRAQWSMRRCRFCNAQGKRVTP